MDINVNEAAAKDLLAYAQKQMDEDARNAHKEGRLVCWSAALAPAEFCEAMDVAMVYPETHSAGCGAKKGNMGLLECADKKGYNIDICSYARNNIGFMEMLKQQALTGEEPQALIDSKAARVPLPDFVLTCNNICNTLLKWYENLARELNIPCIIIDAPFNHTMPVPRHNKEYMVEQFRDVIVKLEKICGKPFRSDIEQFDFAHGGGIDRPPLLRERYSAVDIRRRDAPFIESIDLIFHKRDQRRHNDPVTGAH
jgi:benzoyl-CoA reductase/2-hydroxyglutaryl-CoA dehydratase subunit BcrC/BadD/HgdB